MTAEIAQLPSAQMQQPVEVPAGFEDLPAVLSPKALADLLEVSVKSLERWRDASTGPSFLRLPGSSLIRYTRDDVVTWLLASRVEVSA
jgi:hypothetical protein